MKPRMVSLRLPLLVTVSWKLKQILCCTLIKPAMCNVVKPEAVCENITGYGHGWQQNFGNTIFKQDLNHHIVLCITHIHMWIQKRNTHPNFINIIWIIHCLADIAVPSSSWWQKQLKILKSYMRAKILHKTCLRQLSANFLHQTYLNRNISNTLISPENTIEESQYWFLTTCCYTVSIFSCKLRRKYSSFSDCICPDNYSPVQINKNSSVTLNYSNMHIPSHSSSFRDRKYLIAFTMNDRNAIPVMD